MKEEALKLADEIDNFLKEEEQLPWGTKQVYLDMASTMIRRLVEELDKQGEPVAWLRKYGDGTWFADTQDHSKTEVCIPLYTAPQTKPTITKLDDKVVAVTMTDDEHRITEVLWEAPKPLSDEEILEILIDKGICGRLKDGSLCYWQADADLHDFARAIEERHGIK